MVAGWGPEGEGLRSLTQPAERPEQQRRQEDGREQCGSHRHSETALPSSETSAVAECPRPLKLQMRRWGQQVRVQGWSLTWTGTIAETSWQLLAAAVAADELPSGASPLSSYCQHQVPRALDSW